MDPSYLDALLTDYDFRPELLERVAVRTSKPPLELVAPDPSWPADYEILRARIAAAFAVPPASSTGHRDGDGDGDSKGFLAIQHVGSTSLYPPGIPAKDVIDIDLVVPDVDDEASYVGRLEAVGFQFLTRERHWHGHRFFCGYEPRSVNLHVWGPGCPEVQRHAIFRDWLLAHPEDLALYVRAKEGAMSVTQQDGGLVMDYNKRKEEVIRDILKRAFRALGFIKGAENQVDA